MTFPQKIYNKSNPNNFKIANTNDELKLYIKQYVLADIDYECEPHFNFNNKYVDSYFGGMRQHQKEAIVALLEYDIGQCNIPTSTGKTRIQIGIILKDILKKSENNMTGVYVIGNHRLYLSQQLLDQTQEILVDSGIKFDILCVNSDRLDNSDFGLDVAKYNVTSTTKTDEIKTAYRVAKAQNHHLIIVSTYHSFDRLKDIGHIDIATFDEAHETVKEDFSTNVFSITNIRKKYFFTATPKTVNGDGGMANEMKYGKVLYSKSSREMIDAGEMVGPKLHIVSCEQTDANSDNMSITTTIKSFKYHQNIVNENSNGQIAAKFLISTGGTVQMKNIHESSELRSLHEKDNVHIFAFASSDEFGYYYNFNKLSRREVYNRLLKLKDSDKAIILHIDILSEGIDVPGITGVALYRKMSNTKLLQTIGRCLRLFPEDRRRLYSGEISPEDTEIGKFIKPFGYVIIPNFVDEQQELESLVNNLYREYGIKHEDITQLDVFSGKTTPLVENITESEDEKTKDKKYSLLHIIKSIQENMVSKVIENMSIEDLLFC